MISVAGVKQVAGFKAQVMVSHEWIAALSSTSPWVKINGFGGRNKKLNIQSGCHWSCPLDSWHVREKNFTRSEMD